MTTANEFAMAIGKILLNLLTLEFTLRLFLYEVEGPKDTTLNLDQLADGDCVAATPITSYDSLDTLMQRVNARLEKLGIPDRVDCSLVKIRDALAHGRMVANKPSGPFKLLKFSRADNKGRVKVEIAVDLTSQWLKEQSNRAIADVSMVRRVGQSLGLSCFPD